MTNHYGWQKKRKKIICNIVGSLEVCAIVNEEIKLHGKITMINEMYNECVIRVVGGGATAAARAHTRSIFFSLSLSFAFYTFSHYRNIYLVVNNRR